MTKPPRRLHCTNYPITLPLPGAEFPLEISVSRDENFNVVEIQFTSRGKIGHNLDLMLVDWAIKISRAIQDRDPDTGEEMK